MARGPRDDDKSTWSVVTQLVADLLTRKHGEEAAAQYLKTFEGIEEARARTLASQAQARQISAARVKRGEGAELDADQAPPPAPPKPRKGASGRGRPLGQRRAEQKVRTAQVAELRREKAVARPLKEQFRRRHARHQAREMEQAETLARKALEQHGVKNHFRVLPKVAFFAAYMAGLDKNGVGALQALKSVNMPRRRMAQVLRAAYRPRGYTPRRNVTTGKRGDQKRYVFDGRTLGGHLWNEDERSEEHPGAIRVIQVAIFLWVAKTRTRRDGHTYVVRGFGRGVFTAICRCSKDALFGHERGVPGALRALSQSGFISYGQPPADKVPEWDRGPTGHAYNVFWFRSDPVELALEELHRYTAELSKLAAIERVMADPLRLARQLKARATVDAWVTEASVDEAPPGAFSDDEIPY